MVVACPVEGELTQYRGQHYGGQGYRGALRVSLCKDKLFYEVWIKQNIHTPILYQHSFMGSKGKQDVSVPVTVL